MALVTWLSTSSVFYAVAAVSILAAASVFLIRANEVDEVRASGVTDNGGLRLRPVGVLDLFRDHRVIVLFAATALFHLATAGHAAGGTIRQAPARNRPASRRRRVSRSRTMIPVALLTGWMCERWGRKPIFAVGFLVLPLRIFLYTLATSPSALVALQALDGIGAGIYGVAVVSMCADLTKGKGRFNALCGLIATALSVGGVIGPVCSGLLLQHLGFVAAFNTFAVIAAAAALLFVVAMPETRRSESAEDQRNSRKSHAAHERVRSVDWQRGVL